MNSIKVKIAAKKRLITIVSLVIAVIITTLTVTAVFTSFSDRNNAFITGTQTIEITEDKFEISSDDEIKEGKPIDKNPTVINTGKNPCFVRAYIAISDMSLTDNINYSVNSDWQLKADGYYYLNDVLMPEEEAELFSSITISGVDEFNCEITIYAESIDAETGNPDTDWNTFGVQ